MPRCKLMKSTIDALATPTTDVIWWDAEIKGFGLKVPPPPGGRCSWFSTDLLETLAIPGSSRSASTGQ
jgi:hypothetical protein